MCRSGHGFILFSIGFGFGFGFTVVLTHIFGAPAAKQT
jgi:hypothetical protein